MKTEGQRACEARFRASRKQWMDDIRSVPCLDCKGVFPPECMDFDHLPEYPKSFGIMRAYASYSKERILAEIAKCEIVCANCHRIRTAARR